MSLLSPYLGAAVPATASGKTPVDELYTKWTVAAAMFFLTFVIAILTLAGPPSLGKPWLDGMHYLVGRDFLNTWLGGRSAFSGGPAPWFDYRVYNEAIQHTLGIRYPDTFWSYPPHIVLFVWPLGLLPYPPAYLTWCAIGIALYLVACRGAIPRQRLLFLAVAPSIAVCLFFGQNGFYTAALLIGGLLNVDRTVRGYAAAGASGIWRRVAGVDYGRGFHGAFDHAIFL